MSQAITDLLQMGLHLKAIVANLTREKDKVLASGKIADILTFYHTLDTAYGALDKQRKAIYKELDFLNKSSIPEALEATGLDKVRVPALGRSFYIVPKMSASILDKEKGFEWLRANQGGELITETVNAGSLAAFLKHMMTEEAKDPPSDVFKVTPYNTTGSAKYTPKGEK